jgi:predicted O-methyltransferase YrrM
VYTEAILEHNRKIAEDQRYRSTIVPTRDGVMVAIRVS